jgi:hypothetical protein
MRKIELFLVALTAITGSLTGAAIDSEVSPCDLSSPNTFLGRIVSISGRIVFSMHGTFIISDSCKRHTEDIVVMFPKRDGTPAVNFDIDQQTVDLLKPFLRPTGGTTTACAVMTGQVFYKNRFRSKMEGAGPQGNGFGPRGAFRLAFVVRSINEIHGCR